MKIAQYCSVCKAEYEMDVVPTADDDGVLWLQCPICKGYLPKVKSAAEPAPAAPETDDAGETTEVANVADAEPADEAPPAEADLDADVEAPDPDEPADDAPESEVVVDEGLDALADLDPAAAVPYRPWETYEVGAVVHHLAWDDYGVVLDKETLPGRRRVVKVRFQDAGLVRLREDDGS